MDIDRFRQIHLSVAEGLDAWRVVPRTLVALYCYMLYKIIEWYMALEPHIIDKCVSQNVLDCIAQAPTTQHAALVTAVVGISAAVFGLYTTSGKKWNGFTFWKKKDKEEILEEKAGD
jgi:hypothetical protein